MSGGSIVIDVMPISPIQKWMLGLTAAGVGIAALSFVHQVSTNESQRPVMPAPQGTVPMPPQASAPPTNGGSVTFGNGSPIISNVGGNVEVKVGH